MFHMGCTIHVCVQVYFLVYHAISFSHYLHLQWAKMYILIEILLSRYCTTFPALEFCPLELCQHGYCPPPLWGFCQLGILSPTPPPTPPPPPFPGCFFFVCLVLGFLVHWDFVHNAQRKFCNRWREIIMPQCRKQTRNQIRQYLPVNTNHEFNLHRSMRVLWDPGGY